ncbi:hypothetical protein FN846DRAFT_1007157 [Sphaerosporella brunnea]|uniref:P-loop containing nucleoside triphosphate hydrolase protein n=1 Tax=Sphaerosporella brunnea TaxID=1250544 RepID=A0A5J5F202_9PEZI|nr:hypothetical protein FN846DRAFT_1007157 [Sphaerosporella brunnea]
MTILSDPPQAVPGNGNQYSSSSPVLRYTRYYYPLVLFLFFTIALGAWGIATSESSKPTPPPVNGIYTNGRRAQRRSSENSTFKRIAARFPGGSQQNKREDERRLNAIQKGVMNWLLAGVLATLVANAVNVIMHALTNHNWWCGKDYVISNVARFFTYALLLISQLDSRLNPTFPHFSTWILGLAGEILLVVARITTYEEGLQKKPPNKRHIKWGSWEIVDLSIDVLRAVLLLILSGTYLALIVIRKPTSQRDDAEETTGLLSTAGSASGSDGEADYGSIPAHRKHGLPEPSVNPPAGWGRRTNVGKQSWWEYLRGYAIFFPYLWPSKDRKLQILMIICFCLVLLQRGINVLVPHQLGKVTDSLSGEEPRLPWVQIFLYILFRFLQGNMGLLGAIRSALWIPIGQYSYQALSTSAFEHVHSLSLDFHLGKKTGEVLSALSKGNAINNFLEQVSFQVVPMLVDLAVAVAYFLVEFDAYYALIVAIVTLVYLYLTVRLAQWRADIRREMVNKSREEDAVKNDSMIAYETVKYFNAEAYEFGRYRDAVMAYQKAEYRVLFSLNIMNVSQNVVFTLGLLVACFLSAYQVTQGQVKVGRFVALLTYLAQLQGPLNFFGTFYRSIQSSMINSERMLELFKEQPTVVDKPGAKELKKCNGEIRFRDVEFSYDGRKQALRGLDFVAKPGTTTAFVGESGGGKTTVLRLLFRFYAAQAGAIEVDGQNVEDVTINSLRKHIGVVPQDTVLFNETVMYNLKYANPDATDEMVYEACRAASIHDKILSFPDGYKTRVGERGLRLSGGEKQRVAIARTILKNPKIILLDEATAALDSGTEQHIQAALKELSRGRTMLVIAHRLSTIVGATQILCMHEGRVAEAGTHEELLALGGRYKNMWNKQIRAEKVEKAKARLDESPDTPVISSSSSSVSGEEQLDSVLPTGQNIGGAGPTVEATEITPATQDVEDIDSLPGNESSRPGGLRRSGSSASIDRGRWNATGLRKALGRSGILQKGGSNNSKEV